MEKKNWNWKLELKKKWELKKKKRNWKKKKILPNHFLKVWDLFQFIYLFIPLISIFPLKINWIFLLPWKHRNKKKNLKKENIWNFGGFNEKDSLTLRRCWDGRFYSWILQGENTGKSAGKKQQWKNSDFHHSRIKILPGMPI